MLDERRHLHMSQRQINQMESAQRRARRQSEREDELRRIEEEQVAQKAQALDKPAQIVMELLKGKGGGHHW